MTMNPPIVTLSPECAYGIGNCFAFDRINEPGACVCNGSGHLLRVPEDAVKPGRSPALQIRGRDQLYVTKIAEGPFVPLT
ncbi:MAG: hypothetical protein ACYTE6_12935 [Planctomycetota bacterium]|jgi:hypothetical protein